MFWKLFGKDKQKQEDSPKPTRQDAAIGEMQQYLERQKKAEAEAPTEYDKSGLSDRARARGRYELASRLMREHADWYRIHVVNNRFPSETKETRQRFKDYLQQYEESVPDLLLAAQDRDEVLSLLRASPNGLSRKQLESGFTYKSSGKFGNFLNQLERGEWIVLQGDKKTGVYKLSEAQRVSDAEFLKSEITRQVR